MNGYTVLGASGFIGSRLAETLLSQKKECYAPTRNDPDIFNRDLGKVFYCIGLTADYADRPFETVEAHVSFLCDILAKARFEKLVYLSSTRLYDGLSADLCSENTDLIFNPANKRHLYDISKTLGENLCLIASGGRTCVARLACVYDATPGAHGFLSELLQRLRKKEYKFMLDSPPSALRDYIVLDDAVDALVKIMDSSEKGIFNVASGENVSNQELADTLNANGCEITLRSHSEKTHLPVCDISRLKAIGITPTLVRTYLQSFMKQQRA